RAVFAQHDAFRGHVDLEGIALVDVQGAPQLDGQHNPPEAVDFPYDARGFHPEVTPFPAAAPRVRLPLWVHSTRFRKGRQKVSHRSTAPPGRTGRASQRTSWYTAAARPAATRGP